MKKLFFLLIITLVLGCQKEDNTPPPEENNTMTCDFCGEYTGIINGDITIEQDNFVFDNNSFQLTFQSNYNQQTGVQIKFIQPIEENYLTVECDIEGDQLTITNEVWDYYGTAIIINGSGTFDGDFTTIDGTFTFSGGATGNAEYFANN